MAEACEVGQAGGLEIEFVWHDSFARSEICKQKTVALEEAALLFNIGAMLTALAADQGRHDEEGLKFSFHYFKQASSVFSYIMSGLTAGLLKPISPDLTVEGLTLCQLTCHSQAQECFYEKACLTNASPKALYKLAAGANFLFKKMYSATKHPSIAKKLHATWQTFARLQMHFFEAEAKGASEIGFKLSWAYLGDGWYLVG